VPGVELRGPRWRLPPAALAPLRDAFGHGRLTARGVDRVLRVAWTLADLAGRDQPGVPEVLQAIDLRTSASIPGAAA
jgi:magnesium chelatase family protein